MRPCIEHGCPTLTPGTRCIVHARAADQQRGSAAARGYGAAHQRTRAQWAPLVATGLVQCWRCRLLIPAGAPWDLGHADDDRTRYAGPEHVACNRATAGRRPSPPR